jgi:hypothetical protein
MIRRIHPVAQQIQPHRIKTTTKATMAEKTPMATMMAHRGRRRRVFRHQFRRFLLSWLSVLQASSDCALV